MYEQKNTFDFVQNGYYHNSDGPDVYHIMNTEHVKVFIDAIKRAKPHLPLLCKSNMTTIIKVGTIELCIGQFSFAFKDDLTRGFKFHPDDKNAIDSILENIYKHSIFIHHK